MSGYASEAREGGSDLNHVQAQIASLKAGTSAILHTRLAHAHPYHVTRIARGVFLVMTALTGVLLLASLTVPLVMPDVAVTIKEFEAALPLPLPMLILFLALLMAVSWVTAGQAALAIARDCPLLPWEQEELRKLESTLGILTHNKGGSHLVADTRSSSPAPLQMPTSRLGSHEPSHGFPTPAKTAGGTLRYNYDSPFGGAGGAPTPHSRGGTPAPYGRATPAPAGRADTPASRLRASATPHSRGGTPAPAAGFDRFPTPPPASRRTPSPALSYRGPDGAGRSTPGAAPMREPTSDHGVVQYDRRPHDSYTIGPDLSGAPDLGGAASWKQPAFSHVEEPWLNEALSQAQTLSQRYPVQAFLEYSVEPDLPFTLVLERATPAMAVRAMVDFVGFLAGIATPRRARIELRSVVHLDRSFYRSVMSAMEPYFPDTVEVRQQGYRVEISFLEPDRNWARYPILPLEE